MRGDRKNSICDVTLRWRRSRTGTAVPCPYNFSAVGARQCRARTADPWIENFPDQRAPIKVPPQLHIPKTNGCPLGAKIECSFEAE
jgi:hypothetical protein